jgi:broad specificity phosphatase PhoE
MTTMLLVRHGQSEWNATGRWQGQADPSLSDLGRRQAHVAASRLGAVDVIVSSPLVRAAHTAEIISSALGVGPVVLDAGLMERDSGPWSGLTRDEIEQGWPGWLASGERPPGFELDVSLVARVRDALDRVERDYRGADVLVVAHGGVIRSVERHHGVDGSPVPNLAGRWLAHHGERLAMGERVVLVDGDDVTVPAMS